MLTLISLTQSLPHHTGMARYGLQRLTANFANGGRDLQNRKAYLRSKITRLDEVGVTELLDGRARGAPSRSRRPRCCPTPRTASLGASFEPTERHQPHLKMATAAKAIAKQEAHAAQTTGALTTKPPPPTVKRWGGAALSNDAKDNVVLYQLYFKLMAHISYQQWTE